MPRHVAEERDDDLGDDIHRDDVERSAAERFEAADENRHVRIVDIVADAVVTQGGECIDVVVEGDYVLRAEAAHGESEDAAAGSDVETALSRDVERLQDLDAERGRLVRAGSEGLFLWHDEGVTRRIGGNQVRVRRNDEALSDVQRLKRLLVTIEPV